MTEIKRTEYIAHDKIRKITVDVLSVDFESQTARLKTDEDEVYELPLHLIKLSRKINRKQKEDFKFDDESNEIKLARYLFAYMQRNNPKAKEPNFQIWAREFDAILRLDERSVDDVKNVIKWCQLDSFWKLNILSPTKLRLKFDQLYLKMKASGLLGNDDRFNNIPSDNY